MKPRISGHFFRRAIISLHNSLNNPGSISQLQAVASCAAALEGLTMLSKAVAAKQASNATSRNPSSQPSSRPVFASNNLKRSTAQNGKIDQLFGQPVTSSVHSKSTRPSIVSSASEPLKNRPANTAYHPNPNAQRNFASLCGSSRSFEELSDVVDLTGSSSSTKDLSQFTNSLELVDAGVYVSDGDFSDDDNLDFETPIALPTLPILPTAAPPATAADVHTSALSWSQSSPSHLHKPNALKRESPEDPGLHSPERKRAKTKRQLPWSTIKKPTEDEVEELYEVAVQPPAKPKREPLAWDKTADELKAQMKQLKTQQKVSVEEAHTTMKSSITKNTAITLSSEQERVKKLVVEQNASVFFTGPAGTGKSVLMRAIIAELQKKYARTPERLAVTASTGLAACNIGGSTLHSFAGIGLGKEDVQTLIKKVRRNAKAKNRWLKTKTLIIDEISMVDGDLFDKLSQIGRIIRDNGRPWGGIQLVITGDFFQLPPVPENNQQRDVKFAFDAATWGSSINHTIGLTQIFRQKDPEFAEMLNEMRLGRISDRTVTNFQSLCRPLSFDDDIEVTELFPTRNEVENANRKRLQALTGTLHRYDAYDGGVPAIKDKLLANMMAPPTLELKKHAQVMLIKNIDESLVNGSLGRIIGFDTEDMFLLRSGLEDSDESPEIKKRIRAFGNALDKGGGKQLFPVVRFHTSDGTVRVVLCVPEEWKVETPTGETQASRKQIPLILAWALSIHKAQGQTLERVKVDLRKVFEKGQAYVALSRATSQQGLQVLGFQKQKVMAHPRVIDFYNKLYSVEAALQKRAAGSITGFISKSSSSTPAPTTKPNLRLYKQRGPQDFEDIDEEQEAIAAMLGH